MTPQSDYEQQLLKQYGELREDNEASVEHNDIDLDSMWENACLAYNVQIFPPPAVRATLMGLQEEISHLETDSLLRCPPHALHISVASLIPVRAKDSPRRKEAQWQSIRHQSQVALLKIAGATNSFPVRLRNVIATKGAIIAVATDDGHIQSIREMLCEYVPLRPTPINIIHSTLFRYRTHLADPQQLLATLQTLTLNQFFIVDELQVRKEKKYPSLDSDLVFVARLPNPSIMNQ